MPTERSQAEITVGDFISIEAVVTAIGGTPQAPTVTVQTKYKGFDGNTDSITVDAIQVVLDK